MNIEVKHGYYGTDVFVTADNVNLGYDARERLYGRTDEGKVDYNKYLGDDITNEAMDLFSKSLDTLSVYRTRDYDSSGLIETLFSKLPNDKIKSLLKELNETYEDNEL